MKKYPTVYTLRSLVSMVNKGDCQSNIDGKWVPSRPLGFASIEKRFRAAWLVFTGKADAVIWPGQ